MTMALLMTENVAYLLLFFMGGFLLAIVPDIDA
jgi:hypothetical protein